MHRDFGNFQFCGQNPSKPRKMDGVPLITEEELALLKRQLCAAQEGERAAKEEARAAKEQSQSLTERGAPELHGPGRRGAQ